MIEKQQYSHEYLDSIKKRFPEYSDCSEQELFVVLQKNSQRNAYIYEIAIDTAFAELEKTVILEAANEKLIEYIFGQKSAVTEKIQNGINYVVNKLGTWDLIIWSWSKAAQWWWETALWTPDFLENYRFVQTSPYGYLKKENNFKYLVVLSLAKNWEDSLWRKKYTLLPKLIEMPKIWSMVIDWMVFKKDLSVEEFKENLGKITQ